MSRKSRRNHRNRNLRIDTLLLANYGIIQPTRLREGITLVAPLHTYGPEDREDLREFALFLMAIDSEPGIADSGDQDERLRDEQ